MRKNMIASFLILGILACGGSNSGNADVASVDGAAIYKTNCVVCHGENGKLGVNGSKDLTASPLTMEDRIAIIKSGKGVMTAFGSLLTEEEIKAVAAYTFDL